MDKKFQVLKTKQDNIFIRMAQILATLGAPVRVKLIHYLSQAPLTVEVLSQKIDQSVANTSMHLRKMLSENLVKVETIGQKRLYSLHPAVFEFWEQSQDFIQKIDPALTLGREEMYGDLNWHFSFEDTMEMVRKKELIILDVRPRDEAAEEPDRTIRESYLHIPNAELQDKLGLIPKKKKVLVVCRGRLCALSAFAVNYLRENNIKAYRLDQSWFSLSKSLSDVE